MEKELNKQAANAFAEIFGEQLASSAASAIGSPWPLQIGNSANVPREKGKPVDFRLTFEGSLSGECFAEFYEPQVSELMAKISTRPSTERADEPSQGLVQVISSAMEKVVAALSSKYGIFQIKVDRVAGLAYGGMYVVPLVSSDDQAEVQVMLYFGAQLLEALSAPVNPEYAVETDEPVIYPHNLKFVMDVELNVSLRFGQRQMPLRDVLGLSSGSVIELDRMVDEPVDLYLDGKLIARGEAVVVDGNYGLRVTEVPQPLTSHFLN